MTDLPRYVTWEEFVSMERIARKRSLRDYVILRLLYLCGLRPGEVQRIIVSDFHGQYLDIYGKAEPHARRVKMDENTMQDLKKYAEEKKLSGHSELFRSRKRRIIKPEVGLRVKKTWRGISSRQIRDIVKKYAWEADIPDWQEVSPMSLRHGFAVRAVERGVPPWLLSSYLGLRPHVRAFGLYTEMTVSAADRMEKYLAYPVQSEKPGEKKEEEEKEEKEVTLHLSGREPAKEDDNIEEDTKQDRTGEQGGGDDAPRQE